jgi:hypothetical protein
MEYGFVVLRCCFSEFSTCSLAGSCCCFALLCVRCAVPALLGCFALTGVLCDTCAGKCYGQRDSTGFGAREKRFKALRLRLRLRAALRHAGLLSKQRDRSVQAHICHNITRRHLSSQEGVPLYSNDYQGTAVTISLKLWRIRYQHRLNNAT